MTVSLNIQGPVATITLDRPEKHNAFNAEVISQLIGIFQQAGAQPKVRVILLSASGKHFSAGADLDWMRRMADMDWQQNRNDALALASLMQTIDRAKKPVICRVQGAAYGGALGLITASDIAIAADTSRFCLSEVKLGILPAVIAPYVVRAMGPRQAQRYFMTAEVIDAQQAERLGIVHQCVAETQLNDAINTCIDALLAGAPDAQLQSRTLINTVSGIGFNDSITTYTAELIAALRTSDEGREGLDAFLQKRQPAWFARLGG